MTDTDPHARAAQTPDDPSSPAAQGGPGTAGFPTGPGPEHGGDYQGVPPAQQGGAYQPGYPGSGHPGSGHQGSGYQGSGYRSTGQPGLGGPGSGYGAGYGTYGSASGSGAGASTGTIPPPTTAGTPGGSGGPRRRRPLTLAAAALAALLVTGGIGGAVGYEAASSGSGGGAGTSVLAGASTGTGTTSAAPAPNGSVESVAQTVLPSVVQLRGASGEGSGIVISADGLILTNAHVLEAGQAPQQQSGLGGLLGQGQQQAPTQGGGLSAVFQNGRTAPVQVVGTDSTADLAVVRAQNVSGLAPLQLGDSSTLQVGQEVVAVGSPLGLSGTVTSGIVSALQRPVATGGAQTGQATVIDAIQTDAAINPGNSGGALVDMQGRVVGITSAIASLGSSSGGQQSGSIGLGFAIPINQAARIGQELIANGYATQAVLGVQVADAAPTGAVLGQVTPGGPAAGAGVRQGDVVTRVNDRVIDSADSLVAAIRSQQPGTPVTLTVATPGSAPRQVTVALGSERAPSS